MQSGAVPGQRAYRLQFHISGKRVTYGNFIFVSLSKGDAIDIRRISCE